VRDATGSYTGGLDVLSAFAQMAAVGVGAGANKSNYRQ